MKLVRFGERGREKPGIVDAKGAIRDLSGKGVDFTPEAFAGDLHKTLSGIDPDSLPAVGGSPRLGAPFARTGHFIAIGLNYIDHAKEAGQPIPKEPVIFSKAPSSICGPNDDVPQPKGSTKLDWEVELGFVISRRAWQVSQDKALDHVFGYFLSNDVSERAWQLEGSGQWIKGKSGPNFGPCGPWLVTGDELGDPQDLDMWLDVNGERMQTGNTKTMIFPVAELVSFMSQRMILEPGDIVITGTPPGVGLGKKPKPIFLMPGDVVTLGMTKLGEQKQKIVKHSD